MLYLEQDQHSLQSIIPPPFRQSPYSVSTSFNPSQEVESDIYAPLYSSNPNRQTSKHTNPASAAHDSATYSNPILGILRTACYPGTYAVEFIEHPSIDQDSVDYPYYAYSYSV